METNLNPERKRKVSLAGLRRADPTTLQVLAQDALRTPLVRLEASTLADLLALSELPEGALPLALRRDLSAFQRQMFRELSDLPDGPPLLDLAIELRRVAAAEIPACLRDELRRIQADRHHPDARLALDELIEHAESAPPAVLSPPRAPERASGPRPVVKRLEPAAAPPPTRPARSPAAAQAEDMRGAWIEEDVLARLRDNPGGVKESLLVGGCRHRAPWSDLSEAEVLKVVRRLGRERRARSSAGRWYLGP